MRKYSKSKTINEAVEFLMTDVILKRIDFGRSVIEWADEVGNAAGNLLSSYRDDKRVSKRNMFLAMREMVKEQFCHNDDFSTDMVMGYAYDTLCWLDLNGYLSTADSKKLFDDYCKANGVTI